MLVLYFLVGTVLLRTAETRLGLPSAALDTATFDEFIQQNDEVMVDFFDSLDANWTADKKELDEALLKLRKVGKQMKFAQVDVSRDPKLGRRFVKNGRYPQIIWFAHGHATHYHKTARLTDEIVSFWHEMNRPVITTIQKANEIRHTSVVLAEIPKKGGLYKSLDAVALKHMYLAVTYHIESSKGQITWMEKENVSNNKVYSGDTSFAQLDKWFRSLLPLVSEPIPQGDDAVDRGSYVVVGDNFADVVLQDDKDVMLMMYAPWCGYCKKFMPDWERFAKSLSGVPHLVVAKMDATQNQLVMDDEEWGTTSFPTIFYKQAGSTYPVPFYGDRSMERLLEFVRNQTTQELNMGLEGLHDGDL